MYEKLIETLKSYMFGYSEDINDDLSTGNGGNTLVDNAVKLISHGNITFEGKYINARILEKKSSR